MKTLVTLLACLLLAGALTSCQTTRGFGEDVSTLGNRISQEAEEHMD